MSRSSQRESRKLADTPRTAVAPGVTSSDGAPTSAAHRDEFIIFRIDGGSFGFRLDDVGEIIRLPILARMPLAPKSLLGLANLRGEVIPVVDVRCLLGSPAASPDKDTRVIVVRHGAPVAFVIDRIEGLLKASSERMERADAGAGTVDPDLLDGVVKGEDGGDTIKILNPRRLLGDEFSSLGAAEPRSLVKSSIAAGAPAATAAQQHQVSLVSFDLEQQEYALPINRVREIIPLPDQLSKVPRPETAVLGVVTLRDRLLPIISMRALLGLPSHGEDEESRKVIVLSMGAGSIGLVADRAREILRVAPAVIDPAPALLTRGEGEAEISSICRLEQGKRLVAVLSPDRLFRSELVRRVLAEQFDTDEERARQTSESATMADEEFIIFQLGNQEYGLPIRSVDEIARRPDHITRLPKAPAFIDGVISLRGIVVPVVDLTRRFELSSQEPASARRVLVMSVGDGKIGFVVDRVSEVMKVPVGAIRPAPEVSGEQMRLVGRVINLEAQHRMILLVDPAQLLDRVEADFLAKFDRTNQVQGVAAS
jgi:purine-binding chemotaxis protein CheW